MNNKRFRQDEQDEQENKKRSEDEMTKRFRQDEPENKKSIYPLPTVLVYLVHPV